MNTISVLLNENQLAILDTLYSEYKVDELPNEYVKAFYKPMNCSILVYKSNKVVFQGIDCEEYASLFVQKKEVIDHAGSDEVGTGDFFGPICVCATIVKKEDEKFLNDLGVRDSKKITDEMILKIAPQLVKRIPYSLLVLDNEKYNEVNKVMNMNAIKTKLHNQAFLNLSRKYGLPEYVYLDQFCSADKYYEYLINEEEIVTDIIFETKAEDKYLAVGCGSIIARYAFLKAMDKLNKHYGFTFEKGANEKVDNCLKEFISKYGEDKLYKVAKLNFRTLKKI